MRDSNRQARRAPLPEDTEQLDHLARYVTCTPIRLDAITPLDATRVVVRTPSDPQTMRFKRKQEDPELRSERAKRDALLREEVRRVHEASKSAYGVAKVWLQLKREGIEVARCTVERPMGELGLLGIRRGKRVKSTIGDESSARPDDLVQRDFTADRPNQLGVNDFTYVSAWLGFFFVAFVVDVFSRRIVGWRLSRSTTKHFVLDAIEQAIQARGPGADSSHQSDQGSHP